MHVLNTLEATRFCVLPSKPSHKIAKREGTVTRLGQKIQELGHNPVLNRVRTSRKSQQWYFTESGEKKLYKICTNICSLLLRGAQVDMTRSKSDADIHLEFDHHRYHWRIEFPSDYPNSPPEIGYYDRIEQYRPVTLRNRDIMSTIRSYCRCTSCMEYAPRVY